MTSGVTVVKRGSAELAPMAKILDYVAARAIGMIQTRSAKGIGINGPMKPYSHDYIETLHAMGESSSVDLTVTGAYLTGISERSRTVRPDGGTVVIGPGTGTSEKRAPPTKGKARAVKTGKRSPPHNVLGAILQRTRPHVGLTADEMKKIADEVRKILVKQGR